MIILTKQDGFGTYDNHDMIIIRNNNIKPNIIEVNYICNDPLNEGKVGLAYMIMITR